MQLWPFDSYHETMIPIVEKIYPPNSLSLVFFY
jgi:hypothetical protein